MGTGLEISLWSRRRGKHVALYSRLGRSLTPRFLRIAKAVGSLPVTLDGELVLADEKGINFYGMRGARPADDVTYWVFDILDLNGKDLRELPLTDRRRHLHKLLARTETVIYPVPSFRQRAGAAAKVSRLIITVLPLHDDRTPARNL